MGEALRVANKKFDKFLKGLDITINEKFIARMFYMKGFHDGLKDDGVDE